MDPVAALERIVGYRFDDHALASEATTHSSILNEPLGKGLTSNERLAFVGDAVIGLVVAQHLARPGATKGDLTERRKDLVGNVNLAKLARSLQIPWQHGAGLDEGAATEAWAGLYEAVVGAAFLDRGYEPARKMVLRHLGLARQ